LRWNKNLETVSEYSAEEIAQMRGSDFVPTEEQPLLAEAIVRVFSTGHAEIEITFVTKTGKRIPYYCTGTRIDLEGKPRLIGVGIDISKLQQAEEEIKKLNRDLGQRVLERTAQLNAINKELESFSYSVSHDLRAPLRAIGGFAKMLQEDHCDRMNEDALFLVQKILEADDRMSHLIDDLLTYSRIGRSAIHLRPVPLNELLGNVSSDFTQRIKVVGGTLSIENLPTVTGDPTLLGQVFENLFDNALNYRKRDVPLQLTVSSHEESGHAVICITDNGIGIAPMYHQRIFDVFQRLHTSQAYEGTGIGLANVKKSVELMGGKVWVESEPDQGSTFCIKLKSAPQSQEAGESPIKT
jgi:PAS domain S-box-containing protein